MDMAIFVATIEQEIINVVAVGTVVLLLSSALYMQRTITRTLLR